MNLYSPSRWTGTPIAFTDITTIGGTEGFRCADRLDPYWGGMWTQGSNAVWVSRQLADAQVASGVARMPAALDMDMDEAVAALESPRHFGSRLAMLACLDQWRTVSAEQLAALTGWTHLASRDPRSMVAAFTAGVIDRGTFTSALLPGASSARSTVYRPSRSDAFDRVIAPTLSYEQLVSVTGGSPWDFRRQYDRHNLLSVELGLRVAEMCEVGTVIGEKLSTVELLTSSRDGAPAVDSRAADLTVVRADGMRIAIELTASAGPDFEEKVRRWARLLASRPLSTSGLSVLFIEAAPADAGYRAGGGQLRAQVYKAVAKVVREFPGTGMDRVAERIGVVSWQQWFPAPGQASEEFLSMEVDRPTGPAHLRWERASLLDIFEVPFDPVDDQESMAITENASMLLGTPHWLRTPDTMDLWPVHTDDIGWSGLPTPPPSRENRFSGQRSAASLGTLGVTRSPSRMRTSSAWPSVKVKKAPAAAEWTW